MANSNSSNGIGVLGLLGIVFITLKLCKIIDWSWWYVTMPFWGAVAILIVVIILYIFFKLTFKNKFKSRDIYISKIPKRSKFQDRINDLKKTRNDTK